MGVPPKSSHFTGLSLTKTIHLWEPMTAKTSPATRGGLLRAAPSRPAHPGNPGQFWVFQTWGYRKSWMVYHRKIMENPVNIWKNWGKPPF